MLWRIGTVAEIAKIRNQFPLGVIGHLFVCTSILDEEYGEDWDGGYSLIAETAEDVSAIGEIIDFDQHPCEWVYRLEGDYLTALYLLSNDFSIVVYMPISVAPEVLMHELEEEKQ